MCVKVFDLPSFKYANLVSTAKYIPSWPKFKSGFVFWSLQCSLTINKNVWFIVKIGMTWKLSPGRLLNISDLSLIYIKITPLPFESEKWVFMHNIEGVFNIILVNLMGLGYANVKNTVFLPGLPQWERSRCRWSPQSLGWITLHGIAKEIER